jgi:hypothetical protein
MSYLFPTQNCFNCFTWSVPVFNRVLQCFSVAFSVWEILDDQWVPIPCFLMRQMATNIICNATIFAWQRSIDRARLVLVMSVFPSNMSRWQHSWSLYTRADTAIKIKLWRYMQRKQDLVWTFTYLWQIKYWPINDHGPFRWNTKIGYVLLIIIEGQCKCHFMETCVKWKANNGANWSSQ